MEKFFSSDCDVTHCIIPVTDFCRLQPAQIKIFAERFVSHGFVIFEGPEGLLAQTSLLSLGSLFGSVHMHERSRCDGIAPITYVPSSDGYLGCSNEDHPPHTDGSFEELPPAIVCLHCVKEAKVGGLTILISAKCIVNECFLRFGADLNSIKTPDAVSIERGEKSYTGPLIWQIGDRYGMRFRSDLTANVTASPSSRRTFETIKSYVLDVTNQLRFKLRPGQLLVLDNFSVLHGRTAFTLPSNRLLNRINFKGNSNFCSALKLGFEVIG